MRAAPGGWSFGRSPFLVAGPCVIEDRDTMLRVGEALARLADRLGVSVWTAYQYKAALRDGPVQLRIQALKEAS